MVNPNQPNQPERTMVAAILDRYIQLRMGGLNEEATKRRLQPAVAQLSREDIGLLVSMTKDWETTRSKPKGNQPPTPPSQLETDPLAGSKPSALKPRPVSNQSTPSQSANSIVPETGVSSRFDISPESTSPNPILPPLQPPSKPNLGAQTPPNSNSLFGQPVTTPSSAQQSAPPMNSEEKPRSPIRRVAPTSTGNPVGSPSSPTMPPPPTNLSTTTFPAVNASGNMGVQADRIACPKCGKLNHKTESICYSCGTMLTNQIETRTLDGDTRAIGTELSHFAKSSSLVIYLLDAKKSIEVFVDSDIMIGRSTPNSVIHPEVDLSPYEAEKNGVSRLHVKIVRAEDTLTIIDMKSRNRTYINGQRLHPNEVRVIQDGDEVMLGKLRFRLIFRHNS